MKYLLAFLFVLCAIPASAQTKNLQWEQPITVNQTLVDVQAFTYTLKVDTATPVKLAATCAGTPIVCTAPLPTLPSGTHTLTLAASNAFGAASVSISGEPPSAPVKLTVTITVTVP